MFTKLQGGQVFDPENGRNGEPLDLWIRDGRIVDAPPCGHGEAVTTYDVGGLVVMPSGVDVHSHVCGPGVNEARHLQMGTGTPNLIPTAPLTGKLYVGLGYGTVFDAAIAPSAARGAQQELCSVVGVDKSILVMAGNHPFALQLLERGETERFHAFCAWLLDSTKAFGLKLVNVGGVANWASGKNGMIGVDDPLHDYRLTPRQILAGYAQAADDLALPHPVHIHCGQLGMAGNWKTTLDTMQALGGHRGHITHVQFNSYGGNPSDPSSLCSGARPLIDYVNAHPEITVDVGQVVFSGAMCLTGDLPAVDFLKEMTKSKRVHIHFGCDGGCGVMPLCYREHSYVSALQWAIGLEWFLRVENPWQIAMSTDHPNGGSFLSYPEIVALLMSNNYRREVMARLPPRVRDNCTLWDISREYTFEEIAIITRAAPARMLGLRQKGHLGVGADADVAVYPVNDDRRQMFSMPQYVFKGGQLVLDRGEIRSLPVTPVRHVVKPYDGGALGGLNRWLEEMLAMRAENFPILPAELPPGALAPLA